jgi:diadenosine tetraphosphate (Ap4A) HIT family hydrolase
VTEFQLDPRLDADTLPVAELPLASLRLMNDRRWPWLILVPRIVGACEVHDLSEDEQTRLSRQTALAGRIVKQVTRCEKINTAAIGNIVRQLHVHVIGRAEGDANWPGPVWGYGVRAAYDSEDAAQLIARITDALQFSNGQIA